MSTGIGAKAAMTTIKVPQPLRQRIAGDAAEEGVTAAVFLAGLIDRYERDRRFSQVRRAYAALGAGIDGDYAELTQVWDDAAAEEMDVSEDINGV